MYTDDPVMDAERWLADQDERLKELPVCCCCTEPIQQETAICINDEWVCDECLDTYFRKSVEDYIA